MRGKTVIKVAVALGIATFLFVPYACSPPKPEPVKTVTIPDGEIDPAVWGPKEPQVIDWFTAHIAR